MKRSLAPEPGKEYKLFLVEVDDDDRERVLAGRVGRCEIVVEPEYADIHVGYSDFPVARYRERETVTMTLNMVPSPDGTYFEIQDFSTEVGEE